MAVAEGFYATVNGRSLYAVYHPAESRAAPEGFVFCPAFGEEGECARRHFHLLASEFASRGVPVICPDLSGTGNSDGDMTRVTLPDWVEDIDWCARELERLAKVQSVGLLGLRFGCALSLLVLPKLRATRKLILWDPPLQPGRHFYSLLRRKVIREILENPGARASRQKYLDDAAAEGVLDFDGFRVCATLINELTGLEWNRFSDDGHEGLRVVVASLDRRGCPEALLPQLRTVFRRAEVEELRLGSAPPKFWTRMKPTIAIELIAATSDWATRGYDREFVGPSR